MANLLIVDEDPLACKMLSFLLEADGFEVSVARSSEAALCTVRQKEIDLLLIDVMLPGVDGFALCDRLRKEGCATPVIFLTARNDLADRVHGLQLGADDYVVKPFEGRELVARVKAVLRRYLQARTAAQEVRLRAGNIALDVGELRVYLPGHKTASLTRSEMKVLRCLMSNADSVVSRDTLSAVLWGNGERSGDQISVYMRRLRQKIEPDPARPRYIECVRSLGYRFRPPE